MKTKFIFTVLILLSGAAQASSAVEVLKVIRERFEKISPEMPANKDFEYVTSLGKSKDGTPCEVVIFGRKDNAFSVQVLIGRGEGENFHSSFSLPVKKFVNTASNLELRLYDPGDFSWKIDEASASVNEHFKMQFYKDGRIKSVGAKDSDAFFLPKGILKFRTCYF